MATPSIRRPGRLLFVGAALAVALALPASALADTTAPPTIFPAYARGATVSLTGGSIVGRLVANTTVTFTCEPFLVYDWNTGQEVESTEGRLEDGSVTILQASGRTINYGQVQFWSTEPVVCDGVTVNRRDLGVVASVAPWRMGSAVAGATVYIAGADFSASRFASTGPVTIKLGR